MPHDIDHLTAALKRAYPDITVEPLREQHSADHGGDDEAVWFVRHPSALVDVHVGSTTGDAPFLVQSDLAPPTPARSVEEALRLVTDRLGLRLRAD